MHNTEKSTTDKLGERLLLATALATLAGYLGLAWAVLRKERRRSTIK